MNLQQPNISMDAVLNDSFGQPMSIKTKENDYSASARSKNLISMNSAQDEDLDTNSENRDKIIETQDQSNNTSDNQLLRNKLHLSLSKLKGDPLFSSKNLSSTFQKNSNTSGVINSARNVFNNCSLISSSPRKGSNQPFISNIMNRSFSTIRQQQLLQGLAQNQLTTNLSKEDGSSRGYRVAKSGVGGPHALGKKQLS